MASLTEAQKKRLKAHSKSQTATHMKKMVSLMRAGKSFSDAHKQASAPVKQKQKQSQKQTQKVVVNIGTMPRRRGRKPRAKPRATSYQQDSSRVLAQFAQPEAMLPSRTIYPVSLPQEFSIASPSPTLSTANPERPAAPQVGAISGRAELPPTPLMSAEEVRKIGREYANAKEPPGMPSGDFWDGRSTLSRSSSAPEQGARMTPANNPDVMAFNRNMRAAESLRRSGAIPDPFSMSRQSSAETVMASPFNRTRDMFPAPPEPTPLPAPEPLVRTAPVVSNASSRGSRPPVRLKLKKPRETIQEEE